MPTTTKNASAMLIHLTGKGKAKREMAFMRIAPMAFVEIGTRTESINNMREALGLNPSEQEVRIAKQERMVGYIARKLPVGELPKGCKEGGDKLEFARDLLLHYARAPEPGKTGGKLRASHKGRRTAAQQRIVRNAEQECSTFFAELGLSNAKTIKETNDKRKTRAPHRNASDPDNMPKGGKGTASKDTLGAAGPVKATTRDEACAGMMTIASTALAYSNKYGKLLPTDFGMAAMAFKTAINTAMNAEQERKAKADAIAAEKSK